MEVIRLKKVKLQDIAELLGVTSASVSMILNGKDISRFSPELVAKVIDTARQLGYTPPSSRSDHKQIAVISPNVMNPYHTRIIMGIENAAYFNGYFTCVYNTYWNPSIEERIINHLAHSNICGVIYITVPSPEHMEKVKELNSRIPLVVVSDKVNAFQLDTVDIDNYFAGKIIAEHLISLGHKHVAYLTTDMTGSHIARARRCEALQDTYKALCPEGDVTVYCKDNKYEQEIHTPDIELNSGRELAFECVKNPNITAIVAINDMVAYGVLDGLISKGYRVPEDYSLCGFDNAFPSDFSRISLTTVDHSVFNHGMSAFHLLKEKIENTTSKMSVYPITRVEYSSQLIVRESTAAPRSCIRG